MASRIVPQVTSLPTVQISTTVAEFLIGLNVLEIQEPGGSPQLAARLKKLNMAICSKCRTFMFSQHRHDFVECQCTGKDMIFIDGGDDYCRMGGNPDQFITIK